MCNHHFQMPSDRIEGRDQPQSPGRRMALVTLVSAAGSVVVAGCVPGGLGGGLGGGGGLVLVSPQEEARLGLQTWQQILQDRPLSTNANYQRAADQIIGRIVQASGDRPSQWEVRVFRGPDQNAFALPGNKVGIYEGMFGLAQNDAQLATVLSHEVSHVYARHSAQRISNDLASQIGMQALSAVLGGGGGGSAYGQQIAAVLGAGVEYGLIMPYNRNQELEADALGLRAMAQAGYDPSAALVFWDRMAAATATSARPPEFLSTHPSSSTRIAQIEQLLPEAMAIYRG